MPMMTLLIAGALAIGTVGWADARAAERSQVMLVLDASGSMWGRVEGREKILIAREVVGGILDDWNPAVDLGVIAYGHRRKGDCADIETVVAPGPVDPAAIRRTIEGLIPKGKTPLSAAVQQAARELRHTEERATVILVSDGLETCDADPCAVGEELARTGVDFTAHVIGFDIGDEERAQLQCLAEATGGRYFDADRADQLQTALAEAVHSVQEQPAGLQVALEQAGATLTAPDSAAAGGSIEVGWEGPDGRNDYIAVAAPDMPDNRYENYTYTRSGNPLQLLLPDQAGVYELRYFDNTGKQVLGRRPIEVLPITARIEAPDEAVAGRRIEVTWEGPDNSNDHITVAAPDAPDNRYENYTYTRTGNPLQLLLPDQAGIYELRYVSNQSKRVLTRRPIVLNELGASLNAPDENPAGQHIEVTWEGPDNRNDYIAVAAPDTPDNRHENYAYTRTGNPVQLLLPDQAGIYELRYVSGQSKRVLIRRPIVLTRLDADLRALDILPAGQSARVDWQGPDNRNDYIAIALVDQPDNKYQAYAYTRSGNPVQLKLPEQPGAYELRYVSGQSKRVLIRRPVSVVAADAFKSRIAAAERADVTLQALDGSSSGAPLEGGLNWTLYAIEGPDTELLRSDEARPHYQLPMGVYRVTVQGGTGSGSLDFVVNPGETLTRSVTLR